MIAAGRAPLWRRALATLLDGAIGAAAWGLGALWLIIALRLLRPDSPDAADVAVLAAAVLLLAAALHAVYHVSFVGGCGQTPGRMALGIAVMRRDGAPPGVGRAVARVLGGVAAVLSLGLLTLIAFAVRRSGGFSDWVAGTQVVRVGRAARVGVTPS